MKAHSTQTKRTYDSWDDLIAEEANWFAVVIMMQSTSTKSGKTQNYSRVIGPFPDKQKARNKAAAVRRAWKRSPDHYQRPELLGVSIEPIWSDLDFGVED